LPDPALFHQTLLRTYEETLDCPEINGVRTIAEIMEGHRAQGKHDPSRWWLAHSGRDAVGVLLLTDLPECASWELAYVGVVPEARRRGFGRQLVARALSEAGTAGAARMTLSVDVRNQQAWNLYIDMGFEAFERREAYLAIWSPSHASKPVDLSRRDKLGCSPNLGDC
jgi:ribosomal protein S18 acetylase RimI-like enzyme